MNKDREQIFVIKKKKGGHGHHGGAWKVAFADFMTAMFAMFLVLWIVNQSSDVKTAISGYFQDPLGAAEHRGVSPLPGDGAPPAPRKPPSKEPSVLALKKAELDQLAQKIRERIAATPEFQKLADHLQVTVTNEGLQIELAEDSSGVFFESGNATPRAFVQEFLSALGKELAALPNGVIVDGYTDALPYSSARGYGNWELSADRANAARRLLSAGGLPEAQLKQVRGHADRDLKDPANPTAPRNRRVTITMLIDGTAGGREGGTTAAANADSLALAALGADTVTSRLPARPPAPPEASRP